MPAEEQESGQQLERTRLINQLHKNGMAATEITQFTGISVDEVQAILSMGDVE